MSETVISVRPADLSYIETSLSTLNSNLSVVNHNIEVIDAIVEGIDQKHDALAVELDKLSRAFYDYVGEYRRKTELQLAETQIVKIRQQIETKFGYYAEIRRMATGILQGVDNRLVTVETLQYATEEIVIKAPGYWLAPTLACVAAWLRDDKQTAERALREAIRRDDYKTSLFFTLLTRRINRTDAVLKWIERYFQHQNSHDLDREFIIILESVSTGVFPPASKEIMIKHVKAWVEELSSTDDFINKQKDNWIEFFKSKKDTEPQKQYPALKQFATNWETMQDCLQLSKANKVIHDHFTRIVTSGSGAGFSLIKQLDKLLDSLVTNFDDEELPLRKKERECELIIEKAGDKDAALAMMAAEEKIFEEKVDFLQMLTNAAFNPERSGVTAATQALALSISQPWVLEAYNSFVAGYRSDAPIRAEFDIDGWIESTADGSEEKELLYKQHVYYENLKTELLANAKFPISKIVIPVLLIIVGLLGIDGNYVLLIAAAVGAFMIFRVWKAHENYKNSIEAQVENKKIKAAAALRGVIADRVDFLSEYKIEDNRSDDVLGFLDNINSEQFMSLSKGAARSILK